MRLLLVAIVLLLPAVAAQGPPTPTVTIASSEEHVVASRESDVTFTLTVGFESDNPFDGFNERRIQVTRSDLPEGWSVVIEPSIVMLTAGQTETVRATVTLGGAARQSEVDVTFTARLARQGPANPVGDVVDPEATAQTLVTLQREDPLTREVLEGVGGWIWALLGGLALLAVVLAVVLSRSNRSVVALSTPVRQATVAPGRSVAVPVVVENLTSTEDNVVFHVAPSRNGWAASLPVPELALDGKRREELHLVVSAPQEARPGDVQRVGVTATGAQNPRKPAEVVVEVVVGQTEARQAAGDTTFADQQN